MKDIHHDSFNQFIHSGGKLGDDQIANLGEVLKKFYIKGIFDEAKVLSVKRR